jgi:hypothetical protein
VWAVRCTYAVYFTAHTRRILRENAQTALNAEGVG